MDLTALSDALTYSQMWYLMGIYQELYTIQFIGNLDRICVNTYN